MDLLCPHCLKRVSVPNERAGQALNCPLCGGAFMAPTLTPAAAPPPSPEPFRVEPLPPAPPPPLTPPPSAPPPTKPPLPPGDYQHTLIFVLRLDVVSWIPTLCLGFLFLTSFFTWQRLAETSPNLWQLAFGASGTILYLTYLLFTLFLALPLAVVALVLEQRWLPIPPALTDLLPWKGLAPAAVLALTFLLLLYPYLTYTFWAPVNPIAPAMKIAFRLHFLALLACVVEVWLQFRQRRNLPTPRAELRW